MPRKENLRVLIRLLDLSGKFKFPIIAKTFQQGYYQW